MIAMFVRTGMLADADDDNDGVEDATDAFHRCEQSQDQDLDGVGDNADAFPRRVGDAGHRW